MLEAIVLAKLTLYGNDEVKNSLSHRRNALDAFKQFLDSQKS